MGRPHGVRYAARVSATPPAALFVSNGTAEDHIGARLAGLLGPEWAIRSSPLVGRGGAYAGLPNGERVGRVLDLPSGGFPFGSAANLRADLRAGLIRDSLGQWADAVRGARDAAVVIVVLFSAAPALMHFVQKRKNRAQSAEPTD